MTDYIPARIKVNLKNYYHNKTDGSFHRTKAVAEKSKEIEKPRL